MSFSFGTPSSAPATTGLGGGGFNFGGGAKPATPGFGLPATSQPSAGFFGSTPASAAPAFGSTAPTFGATNTSFGATSAAPAFGATTTPSFGSTPAFGAMSLPGFGATSAAPAFGATSAAPTFGAASTAPTFGATSTPAFGTSATPAFGATSTSAFITAGIGGTGLNFGGGTTSTASTLPTFGGATTTTTNTGLGGLGGFSFGTTAGGLWGSTSTATTSSSFFGPKLGTTSVTGTQPSTSATLGGLGGVALASDTKTEPPKQQKLPNEISTTIDTFKEFVKKQKSLSSEVMRVSIKPLHKVSREAEATLRVALSLSGEVSRARAQSRRLRAAAAQALAAAEAAARDAQAPGVELESSAPPMYVKELIAELEQHLLTFRRQMEVADKQMQASPKLLTEQELTMGIRRMHESLVALAGRLQAVHTQVDAQKEQYLNLCKYVLKEPTNMFDTQDTGSSLDHMLKDSDGSRKKSKSGYMGDLSISSAVLADPRAALGNISQLAGPTPFTYLGSTLSPFPSADASGPGWQPTPQPALNTSLNVSALGAAPAESSTGFQLQKPPGKRGKQ